MSRLYRLRKVIGSTVVAIFIGVSIAFVVYHLRTSAISRLYHRIFILEPLQARWEKVLAKENEDLAWDHAIIDPLIVMPYEVLVGDTYWDVAKKTGLSIDTIISYNKVSNTFSMRPHERLAIPVQDGILYKRTEHESLATISARYGVAENVIRYFNPTLAHEAGQKNIFIPGAYFSFLERLEKLGGEFASPLSHSQGKIRITSLFGPRIHPFTKKRSFHKGIDLAGHVGTLVSAVTGGVVIAAREVYGYGKIVMIAHRNERVTRYAHLSSYIVEVGQRVRRGQVIGKIGSSGISTGPHLHFEIWKNNKPINPIGVTDLF